MNEPFAWGNGLSVGLTVLFFGWLFWAAAKKRRHGLERQPIEDEPPTTEYRAFTTEFDRVVRAREAPDILKAADRGLPPARALSVSTWPARLAALDRVAATAAPSFEAAAARLLPVLIRVRGKATVMLLIDQSGSMHENILFVAPSVRWLSEKFTAADVPLAIAGFTTLGWRGGAVRDKWIAAGRPKRPGRLCVLMHIRYRDFQGSLAPADLQAMVHPDALRENIDGEAIEWAISEISQRPEPMKLLIVLSDGAPVDDSTIMENGNNFLARHLRKVIRETEQGGEVRLGAIGIEHRVDEYYGRSADATDLTRLPDTLADLIEQLVRDAPSESA